MTGQCASIVWMCDCVHYHPPSHLSMMLQRVNHDSAVHVVLQTAVPARLLQSSAASVSQYTDENKK